MMQGIGSYLCFSFLSYIYQKTHSLPTYITEHEFTFSKIDGHFWNNYFESDIWIDYHSHNISREQHIHVQTFLEFYHARKLGNPEKLLSRIFKNITTSPEHLRYNIDIIRSHMNKFWKLKTGYLEEFAYRIKYEFNLIDREYATLVIREGDKRTLEPYHLPTNLTHLRHLVVRSGLTHVHLITDSYPQYLRLQAILPPNISIFTTCKSHTGPAEDGFVLKSVQRHWTASERDAEVLETLFNYELARRAKLAFVPASTNIAVWVNLLRLADGNPYSFIQMREREFNYFRGYLPVHQPFLSEIETDAMNN